MVSSHLDLVSITLLVLAMALTAIKKQMQLFCKDLIFILNCVVGAFFILLGFCPQFRSLNNNHILNSMKQHFICRYV